MSRVVRHRVGRKCVAAVAAVDQLRVVRLHLLGIAAAGVVAVETTEEAVIAEVMVANRRKVVN